MSTDATAIDPADEDIVRISDVHALDLPLVELRLVHSTAVLPDLHLERVSGAVFLPDSALLIGDGGTRELVFLDRDGGIRTRSGCDGEGRGSTDGSSGSGSARMACRSCSTGVCGVSPS
ncbi:MAG: hypothetical protein OXT63_01060 [Gemmatimonadota bacterium]|nr:hypothetical protein [Gemmatimonadota bacterium]